MAKNFSFEYRIPSYEKSGHKMEEELIGVLNKKRYDELAFKLLLKERNDLIGKEEYLAKRNNPEDEFERILNLREVASRRLETTSKVIRNENYLDYDNSMVLIEKCQYGDPEKPTVFFAKKLYNYLNDIYGDKYNLKFFISSGITHLDILHGIDCYFKLYDKESGEEVSRCTIDLTGNREKDRAKANVLILIEPDVRDKIDPSPVNKDFDKILLEETISDYGKIIQYSIDSNFKKQ